MPLCSRLVHPDKCAHPKAGDAAAVLNQVGAPVCCILCCAVLCLLPANRCGMGCAVPAPDCVLLGQGVGRLLSMMSEPACCASASEQHPRHALMQAWDTLNNPIKKRAYDAYGGCFHLLASAP